LRTDFGKAVVAVGLAAFSGGAFADVTMALIAPPDGPSMDGVYTSPYTALIGPSGLTTLNQLKQNPSTTTTLVICDDYTTDVSTSTPPWDATVTSVGALSGASSALNTLKFDKGNLTQQQADYTTVAYLAEELMGINQSTSQGQLTAGEISFAIWQVFDPSLASSLQSESNYGAIENFYTQARASAGSNPSAYANVLVYTPQPNGASQEYLVVTPEISGLALLAVDLSGVGGLIFLLRKRLFRVAARS